LRTGNKLNPEQSEVLLNNLKNKDKTYSRRLYDYLVIKRKTKLKTIETVPNSKFFSYV
jgi:hypothetical protein